MAPLINRNTRTYAWIVVALLWIVGMLNYMDRQMLSTMRESIMIDISELESAANFGRLMAVFALGVRHNEPLLRNHRRPHQPQVGNSVGTVRMVVCHIHDGICHIVQPAVHIAWHHGGERGSVYAGCIVTHSRLPP